MDDDNTKCKCVFFGGSCIDDDCVNYRAGRECSLATCTNPACKNRCIQENSFPEHTISTTNETSDEFYMIADCDIDKRQGNAPVYGNAVSLQSLYKYMKESKKRDVKYLVISILPAVAVEFTNCGTTAGFVRGSCSPNAYYRRVVLSSGEKVPVLTATAPIKAGDEITIYVGTCFDPKLLPSPKANPMRTCSCGKPQCKGSVPVESSFDMTKPWNLQQICHTRSISMRMSYYQGQTGYYQNRDTRTPHQFIYAWTHRYCQRCRMLDSSNTRLGEGVGYCITCNIHLCVDCNLSWHNNLQKKYLTATSGNNETYDVFLVAGIRDEESARSADLFVINKPFPQRFDKDNHYSISKARYSSGCTLCGNYAGVSRCVTCFVDLCDNCWFSWHPNVNRYCRLVPNSYNPIKISCPSVTKKQKL